LEATMKFSSHIDDSIAIERFQRLDHESYKYVNLTTQEIEQWIPTVDKKKVMILIDCTPKSGDPRDGWTIVATQSHTKKLKLEFVSSDASQGDFRVNIQCDVVVPLRVEGISASQYNCKVKSLKINKGSPEEVTVYLNPHALLPFAVDHG
jgi:hypothetical protein